MSLLELLSSLPSAQDRFQQVAPLLGTGMSTPRGGGQIPFDATGGSIEQQAQQFFAQRGYSPQDWRKVDYIIENESDWNPHAVNDSSGAAGIAQKISGFGGGYRENDPMSQIRWLFNYLNGHNYEGYGTGIDAAYAHKKDTGWY